MDPVIRANSEIIRHKRRFLIKLISLGSCCMDNWLYLLNDCMEQMSLSEVSGLSGKMIPEFYCPRFFAVFTRARATGFRV